MGRSGHAPCMVLLYVIAALFFVAAITFSTLSSQPGTGLFERTAQNVSAIYDLQITPAVWTFSIWGFIYAWQALWLVYAFTLVCRRGTRGYLYVTPGVLPAGLLLFFSLASASIITWVFLWDRLIIEGAEAIILLAAISLHVALAFGHHRLERITPILVQQGQVIDVWLVRVLVLNGLAFFSTWVTIASCFNFAQVLAYSHPTRIPQEAASTAALALLTVIVFGWFILKNFLFERHLRFTLSPFIVLPIALAGIITNRWNKDEGNSLFVAMLSAVVGLMFIITFIHTIVRMTRQKRHSTPYNTDIKI